jgi:hypothetical protein
MTALIDVDEYRPGRNFIRIGDPVRCRPLVGGPFDATVRRIRVDEVTGEAKEVEVVGGRPGHPVAIRTLAPTRIQRRAATKAGEPVERSRTAGGK